MKEVDFVKGTQNIPYDFLHIFLYELSMKLQNVNIKNSQIFLNR